MQWPWLKNTNLPTRAKWQIDGWFSGPRRDVVGTLGARNALLHWRKWEWNMMMIGLLRCDERYWPDEVWMMILNCSSSLAWTREVSRKRASYGIFVGFLWSKCNNAEYLGRFVSKQLLYMAQNFRQIARRSNSAVIQYQAITRFMCISQIRNVHLPGENSWNRTLFLSWVLFNNIIPRNPASYSEGACFRILPQKQLETELGSGETCDLYFCISMRKMIPPCKVHRCSSSFVMSGHCELEVITLMYERR